MAWRHARAQKEAGSSRDFFAWSEGRGHGMWRDGISPVAGQRCAGRLEVVVVGWAAAETLV